MLNWKTHFIFLVISNYNHEPSRSWSKLNHPTIGERQENPLSSPELSLTPKTLLLLAIFTYSNISQFIALSFSSNMNLLSLVFLEPSSSWNCLISTRFIYSLRVVLLQWKAFVFPNMEWSNSRAPHQELSNSCSQLEWSSSNALNTELSNSSAHVVNLEFSNSSPSSIGSCLAPIFLCFTLVHMVRIFINISSYITPPSLPLCNNKFLKGLRIARHNTVAHQLTNLLNQMYAIGTSHSLMSVTNMATTKTTPSHHEY